MLFGCGGMGGILNCVFKKVKMSDKFVNYNVFVNMFGVYNL